MDEQRESVADGAVKSEQQRNRERELGNAQGVGCRRRQCQSVKAACDARRRIRKNQFLDAPLQQKDREKKPQDQERGWNASIELRRHVFAPCRDDQSCNQSRRAYEKFLRRSRPLARRPSRRSAPPPSRVRARRSFATRPITTLGGAIAGRLCPEVRREPPARAEWKSRASPDRTPWALPASCSRAAHRERYAPLHCSFVTAERDRRSAPLPVPGGRGRPK